MVGSVNIGWRTGDPIIKVGDIVAHSFQHSTLNAMTICDFGGHNTQLHMVPPSDARHLAGEPETRIAYDGNRYTKEEFFQYYGDNAGQRTWNEAGEHNATDCHRDDAQLAGAAQLTQTSASSHEAYSIVT